MNERCAGSEHTEGDSQAALGRGGTRSPSSRPAVAETNPDAGVEKVEWEPLPSGVRLRVWNSDRCWKAIQTQYAFCVVHRGVAEWQYRGQTFNVAAGGIYPLEPGEVHTTRKVHQTGDFSVFFMDPQWVSNLAREVADTDEAHFRARGVPSIDDWRVVSRAATLDVRQQSERLAEDMSLFIGGAVIAASPHRRPTMPSHVVNRARQMIRDQYYADPSHTVNIRTIAKELGAGYHTLVHEFSRHYGAPPYEYVNLLRAQYVLARLRSGPTEQVPSLAVLSKAVGFSDPAHMSRNFRQHFYCSPSLAARQLHAGWRRGARPSHRATR